MGWFSDPQNKDIVNGVIIAGSVWGLKRSVKRKHKREDFYMNPPMRQTRHEAGGKTHVHEEKQVNPGWWGKRTGRPS